MHLCTKVFVHYELWRSYYIKRGIYVCTCICQREPCDHCWCLCHQSPIIQQQSHNDFAKICIVSPPHSLLPGRRSRYWFGWAGCCLIALHCPALGKELNEWAVASCIWMAKGREEQHNNTYTYNSSARQHCCRVVGWSRFCTRDCVVARKMIVAHASIMN